MEAEQKKQVAQAIIQLLTNYNSHLEQTTSVLSQVKSNKTMLVKHLVAVHGNIYLDWEELIETAIREPLLFSQIILKNNEIVEKFKVEVVVLEMSPQYIQLIHGEFSNEQVINNFTPWGQQVVHYLPQLKQEVVDFNIRNQSMHNLSYLLQNLNGFSTRYLQKFAQLDTFEHVKDIEHSIVIVGANGSGKSSFSRNTRRVLSGNVAIISAQKIFAHQQIQHLPLGSSPIDNVRNFQSGDKLGKDWNGNNEYGQDLYNLMLSLISEYNHCAATFYNDSRTSQVQRHESILEMVMDIWGEIITHRKMKYVEPNILICCDDGTEYQFPQLSDGEKAVFYYVAHILLARENSFIIIDEPENHLHMGVVSRLWDKLEKLREDCKFIYLTHNLDFASSRINAKKLWNKSFKPPVQWDVVPLPQDEDLPEILLMEILGSSRKILFCEGEKSSIDYKLYTLLFPEFTIKPVGGHLEVINFTKAFNKSRETFRNTAIGIIDGDFHSVAAKDKWRDESIYCIDAQEVENLICDEFLLVAAQKRFCSQDDSIENAKSELFKKMEREKTEQAIEYATQKINNALKSNLIEKVKTLEALRAGFESSLASIEIDALVSERIALLDEILAAKDFARAIKFYNNKGLVGTVGSKIVGNYKSRIFGLLESEPDLIKKLREKHFSHVPCENREVAK